MMQAGTTTRRRSFALALAVLGLAWLGGWPSDGFAQDNATARERRVKAAFIFKFAGFVEWPETAFPQPFTAVTIAVIGDDELAAELSAITAGRAVEGRPLTIRKTRSLEAVADAHMVFVGRAEIARLPQLAKLARARPVLILTDAPNALAQGSMINFMLVERRVKFEIHLEEAERHGLKLSSRLLAVAQSVRRGSP
jgi:hypothetical protein